MLAVDHASGAIFIKHKVCLRGGETLQANRFFEQWARDAGVQVKAYHTDNGIFAGNDWKADCALHDQALSFSGVGAKHQNGVAKRAIGTCVTWARAMLIHFVIHSWPDETDLDLWPFAFEHAIHIWNHLPHQETGMAPIKIFTGSKLPEDREPLKRSHVWGCPVYVLNPQLQKTESESQNGSLDPGEASLRVYLLNTPLPLAAFVTWTLDTLVPSSILCTVTTSPLSPVPQLVTSTSDVCLHTSIDGLVHQFGGEIENDTPIEFNERGHVEPAPQIDLDWITDDEIRYS
jgi:hypothetical protein